MPPPGRTSPAAIPYGPSDVLHASRAIVDDAVDLARGMRSDLTIVSMPVIGDPRQVLVDLSPRAHLIVMGSRGRGTFRSMVLGSVSASVSRHAACPVVVCRPLSAGPSTHGVVVGADGTPDSLTVIEFGFQQASLRGLPLTVVHCFWDARQPFPMFGSCLGARKGRSRRRTLRLLLSESIAGLSEKYPDVQVSLRLTHGLVDEGLAAMTSDAGLVVVGRHPVHGLSRTFSRSPWRPPCSSALTAPWRSSPSPRRPEGTRSRPARVERPYQGDLVRNTLDA